MERLAIALPRVELPPADRATDDSSILTLRDLVFEPLCRWRDGEVLPGLFARWSHSPDGRAWRFHLRPGATFHDGRPCGAEDAIACIEAMRGAMDGFGMKVAHARYLAGIEFAAAARDVVVARSERPAAHLPEVLGEFHLARPDARGEATIGTGAWRVERLEQGSAIVLRRAARGDGPREIRAFALPGADERLAALRAGAADAATNLERCAAGPDFRDDLAWGRATSVLSVIFYLDCTRGLFASPRARRAANHAVDVQAIIDRIHHGLALRASTIVSPRHHGFAAAGTRPFAHDPGMARALLDGCEGGGELVIRTPRTLPDRAVETSLAVAEDLSRVGLRARLDIQEDRPEYAREVGRKHIGDMAIFDSSPHSTYRILEDKVSSAARGTWWQGHHDPALEAMIDAARAAVAPEDRVAAHAACLRRLAEDPPWLFMFHPVEVFAARAAAPRLVLDGRGILGLGANDSGAATG